MAQHLPNLWFASIPITYRFHKPFFRITLPAYHKEIEKNPFMWNYIRRLRMMATIAFSDNSISTCAPILLLYPKPCAHHLTYSDFSLLTSSWPLQSISSHQSTPLILLHRPLCSLPNSSPHSLVQPSLI